MGKFYKEALIFKTKKRYVELKQAMDLLEQAKSAEDPAVHEKFDEKLAWIKEKAVKDLEVITKRFGDNEIPCWDFTKERKLDVFAEDEEVLLRPLQEQNRDLYIQIKKENSYTITNRPEEEQEQYWEETWNDTKKEEHFVVEVISKNRGEFVGYVAVNNTKQPLWEICIELLNDKTGNGFGTRAIRLFVNEIYAITGFEEYQALVEPDNIRSQKMMKKINAELIDIVDFYFGDQEEAAEFEEKYLDRMDDNMLNIADYLAIEPRKLISHVLDYRIRLSDI